MTFDLEPWHLGWSQESIQDSAECGEGGEGNFRGCSGWWRGGGGLGGVCQEHCLKGNLATEGMNGSLGSPLNSSML